MVEFKPTIGLEIHAELKTKTKMFCDSANDPEEKRPNVNVCPICLAHPGTLPTINKEAVRHVLRVGLAVGGQLADYSEFERKNYFYPDIPKGYQISQYKYPLVTGGSLNKVALTRIHLEEDTARLQHDSKEDVSFVDFNRAGVPLMELVTEPVITTVKQAADFARELRLLLRYLGVSDADMEKGQMRVEANVSVVPSPPAPETPGQNGKVVSEAAGSANPAALGVKVEIKNLNSFRAVERAIDYEIKRQSELLAAGEKIVQETRGWDDAKGITFPQREKESAHDYRYFPEPDLPPLKLSEVPEFQNLAPTLPELPAQKRERLAKLGLQAQDMEQYVNDFDLAGFFDAVANELKKPTLIKLASNFIANDIAGQRKKEPNWPLPKADYLAEIVRRYQAGELHSRQAKTAILSGVVAETKSDVVVEDLVAKIIKDNPQVVVDFKSGKKAALQFLIGQGMKESKGAANPAILEELFGERLKQAP